MDFGKIKARSEFAEALKFRLQSRDWFLVRFNQKQSQFGYLEIDQKHLRVDQGGSSGTQIC